MNTALQSYATYAVTVDDWAGRIAACWQQSVQAIFDTGRLITEAKASLEHGDFLALVQERLPFGPRTAQRLMAVAADPRLTNTTHGSHLPPSWRTLYELTRLDDDQFQAKIADGTIRPEMDRKDIWTAIKQGQRAARETILGGLQLALPQKKYGVILADPEWRFEPWSRLTGMDRAADNHYPTSCTEVIAARDVPSIAAKDSVLFLCATAPMLPHAMLVMAAWGYDYKTNYVLVKNRFITGYWNRNRHEHLLVGTRGKIPCPAPGQQWDSLIEAPVNRHSQKPVEVLEMIEQYFPTLRKIELNRRGPPRDGWDAWGDEAEPPRADVLPPGVDDRQMTFLPEDPLEIPEFLRRTAAATA